MKQGLKIAIAVAAVIGLGTYGADACEPGTYGVTPHSGLTSRPVGYSSSSYYGTAYSTPVVAARVTQGHPVFQGHPYQGHPTYPAQTYAQPTPVQLNYGQPIYRRPVYPVGQTYGRPAYGVSPYAASRPVAAYRPIAPIGSTPPNSYVGPGILGQPKAYVPGQPLRNFARYILP